MNRRSFFWTLLAAPVVVPVVQGQRFDTFHVEATARLQGPSCGIDEFHQHKSRLVWDKLRNFNGTGRVLTER